VRGVVPLGPYFLEAGRRGPAEPVGREQLERQPRVHEREALQFVDQRDLGEQGLVAAGDRHAGGARMWLEERTGKRINEERIEEALALDPDTVSTACPYCMVMLGDAVNAKKAKGEAKESIEVIDVSQLLVRSIKLRAGVAETTGGPEAP
jgi:hypothetical protein